MLAFIVFLVLVQQRLGKGDQTVSEITKALNKCASEGGFTGIVNCAALRVLKSFEQVENKPILSLGPGVSLIRNGTVESTARYLIEDLPQEPTKRAGKLLDFLLEASSRFISSRTLSIKLPEASPLKFARALEEGRGKMKKMMGSFLLGLGGKMMSMVPITFSFLAFMTMKALVVSKLAFVLSLVLFIQMFFGGRNILPFSYGYGFGGSTYGAPSYGTSYGTNNIGGWSPQYPYARSIDVEENAKN